MSAVFIVAILDCSRTNSLGLARCSGCAETWLGKRYAARLNARHKQFPFRRQALKIARPALGTTPQTIAGLRALLEWIDWDCDGLALDEDHVHAVIASLLASPVLAGGVASMTTIL